MSEENQPVRKNAWEAVEAYVQTPEFEMLLDDYEACFIAMRLVRRSEGRRWWNLWLFWEPRTLMTRLMLGAVEKLRANVHERIAAQALSSYMLGGGGEETTEPPPKKEMVH